VAEIATVTTMAQTATNIAPQGGQTASGLDALFGALFQQALQAAKPANDAGGAANANTPPDDTAQAQLPLSVRDLIAQANLVQETAQDAPSTTNNDEPGPTAAASATTNQGDPATAIAADQAPTNSSSSQSADDAANDATAAAQVPASPQPAVEEAPQSASIRETDAASLPAGDDPVSAAPAPTHIAPSEDQTPSDAAAASTEAATQTSDADAPSADDSPAPAQQASKPSSKNGSALTAVATWLTQFLATAPSSPQGGGATAQPETTKTSDAAAAPSATGANDSQTPGTTTLPAVTPTPAFAAAQSVDPSPTADKDDRQSAEPKSDAAPERGQTATAQPSAGGQSAAQPSPAHASQSSVNGQSAIPAAAAAAPTPASQPTASGTQTAATLHLVPQHDEEGTSLNSLGIAIAARSADGTKHFDIRLDPPELGRVEVHLSLDDSGKAQALLLVDKPETLALLRQDAPALGRALSDAGLSLSNNGLNFQLRNGQERQNDGGNMSRGRGRALSVKALSGADAASSTASIPDLALDGARLDIRV